MELSFSDVIPLLEWAGLFVFCFAVLKELINRKVVDGSELNQWDFLDPHPTSKGRVNPEMLARSSCPPALKNEDSKSSFSRRRHKGELSEAEHALSDCDFEA